jgi:hypothetical protein
MIGRLVDLDRSFKGCVYGCKRIHVYMVVSLLPCTGPPRHRVLKHKFCVATV